MYSQHRRSWVRVTARELDTVPHKFWPAGLRCGECHGEVNVHHHENGSRLHHFEHRHRNLGCSQVKGFDGVRRQHPKPLELAPT